MEWSVPVESFCEWLPSARRIGGAQQGHRKNRGHRATCCGLQTQNALPQFAVVYDIVYVPLETPLLAAARARGNVAVDGLGMLLHQARQGFRDWFGPDPEVNDALRAYVLEAL